MPPKKKSSPNPRKSKSLKDLELENEVIYNKKHVWMRRLFFEFLNDRFPKARKPRSLYPATAKLLSDTVLGNWWAWFCLCSLNVFDISGVSHNYWNHSLITFSTSGSLNCIKKWKNAPSPMVFFKKRFLLEFFTSKSKNRFNNLLFLYC